MTNRETTLRKLIEAAQTALDAALALCGGESTCEHPEREEMTAMGAPVRAFMCRDCHTEWEEGLSDDATG